MKLLKPTLITGIFAGAGALMLAHAGTPADYFQKMDANADGAVTEAEFVTYKTADGKVTADEARAKFTTYSGGDGEMTLADLEGVMSAKKVKKTSATDCNKKQAT